MRSDPNARLEAVTIASLWKDPSILPILRRGLKDSDIRVIKAAASGIQKYKASGPTTHSKSSTLPPRNIFLIRYIGRP